MRWRSGKAGYSRSRRCRRGTRGRCRAPARARLSPCRVLRRPSGRPSCRLAHQPLPSSMDAYRSATLRRRACGRRNHLPGIRPSADSSRSPPSTGRETAPTESESATARSRYLQPSVSNNWRRGGSSTRRLAHTGTRADEWKRSAFGQRPPGSSPPAAVTRPWHPYHGGTSVVATPSW